MTTDLVLDSNTHDLDLSEGGLRLHDQNTEAVAQRVKVALLLRKGDWYQNITLGVPYQQEFFVTKNNKTYIDFFLSDYISQVQEVEGVENYSSEIAQDRSLNVSASIRTTRGELITNLALEI